MLTGTANFTLSIIGTVPLSEVANVTQILKQVVSTAGLTIASSSFTVTSRAVSTDLGTVSAPATPVPPVS
jgi:hypothetical protein